MTSNIDDSFFSDYKAEYNFIRDHITNFNSIPDKVTFASKFKDFDFIEVSESASFLVDELYKDKNVRALAKVFNGIRNCINSGDIEGAMDLFNSSHDQLLQSSHLEAVDILKINKDMMRMLIELKNIQNFISSLGSMSLIN
jgi:hypothetical protein